MDNLTKMEINMEKVLNELDDISTRINKLKSIMLKMYHQIDDTSTHSSCEEASPTYIKSEIEKLDPESNNEVSSDDSQSENSNEISEEDSGSDSYEPDAYDQVSDQPYSSYSE